MKKFAEKISAIGGKVYLVGGAVRDTLMGYTPHDHDFVIEGVDESDFVKMFPKSQKVGNSFPVYLVDISGTMCEVAFARTEKKCGSGYTGFSVTFDPSVTIKDDLYRRDLTVNAIAKAIHGDIIDPFGGADDIKNKILRAVSSETFKEDPVRSLRAARFHSTLGFELDGELKGLMSQTKEELAVVPKERIMLEIIKTFSASVQPSRFFRALKDTGLLDVVIEPVYKMVGIPQDPKWHPEGDVFEHIMVALDKAASLSASPQVLFAVLLHDIGKIATPVDVLPKHHGHDKAGIELLEKFFIEFGSAIPKEYKDFARVAVEYHMVVRTVSKPSKIVKMVKQISRKVDIKDFCKVVLADSGSESLDTAKCRLPIWLKDEVVVQGMHILEKAYRKQLFSEGCPLDMLDSKVEIKLIEYIKAYIE